MTDSSHEGNANSHGRRQVADPTLRASWLGRTLGAGRREPLGRRTPAVDAVVAALVGPGRSVDALEHALRALAWERASDPLGLDASLEDLDALWAVLESGGPAPASAAGPGLAGRRLGGRPGRRPGRAVIDPLSGLHTTAYLVARIHELDRLA